VIKNRARELRALGEKKSAAFRRGQVGKRLRVLTLRSASDEDAASENLDAEAMPETQFTPALSSNYLRVRVPGTRPANHWVDTRICSSDGAVLIGAPEEPASCVAAVYAGN
jgi:tRNA A37 methylthiotransferase MiaB